VTIIGKGFYGATEVKFGKSVARILSITDNEIVVLAPKREGKNPKVYVTVKTPLGASKQDKKALFKYIVGRKESSSSSSSSS